MRSANIDSWSANSKRVTATVKNQCLFGITIFCHSAGSFLVYFDGEEVPTSSNYLPHIAKSVSSLGAGESITLTADFTPLARIENNYLWNVANVRVTVDAKNQVSEYYESDNTKLVRAPFSSELPIVIIDGLGGTIVDEPKLPATMRIIYDPDGSRNFVNAPVLDYDGRAGVELRGQLSASFCKKQYGVETWDAENEDLKVSLLNFPIDEDWVLYGPYDDKTLMRNVFAYELSNTIGRYASKTVFVDLFVKDAAPAGTGCAPIASDGYVGIYVLMEKIKRSADRVNVAALTVNDNDEPAVTGGYLLKKDWIDPGDATFLTNGTTGYGTRLTYVYPKCKADPLPCDATIPQKAWIESYMNDFETALKGSGFSDPVNGYAKYIDVPSFVDYYLLQEIMKKLGWVPREYVHV